VHETTRAENDVRRYPGIDRRSSFESFYTARYPEIAGYVRRRVPAQEADDVTAKVFTVAWRRFDRVPSPPEDRPWLFGVARNCVAEQHRSEQRRLRLHARLSQDAVIGRPVPAPAGAGDGDPGEAVRAALDALRPADREALQLVLWEELSHAEAAAVLGCSVNAFELRYRRARRAVRDAVAGSRPPPQAGPAPVIRKPLTSRR
jgi:RNA polymerase sigma factor (sigma-70 family)